jgi:hypothetical protein
MHCVLKNSYFILLFRFARQYVDNYQAQIRHLDVFLNHFCVLANANDRQQYIDDFTLRRNDSMITLRSITNEDSWGMHKLLLPTAK